MTRSIWRIAIALLALLALVAAACGSDSDEGGSETETEATEEAADEGAATEEATETPTAEATEEAAATEEPTEEPTPEIELFDSYEGVTADTIEVGVIIPNLDELREMGLWDANNGDVPLIYDTLINHVNASGGILGRQLEYTLTQYNPVFTEQADTACFELTQDERVFVILGGITGPARDSTLCILETYPTPLIGGTQTPEHMSRAVAPWIAADMAAERRHEATLALYDDLGLLEGKIAVFDDSSETETITRPVVVPALEELGYEMALPVLTSNVPQGDEVALAAEVAVFAERLDLEGIDTLIIVQSQINLGLALMREAGYDGTILTIDSAQALDTIGAGDEHDPAIFEGSYGPMGLKAEESILTERSQECVAIFNEANPDIEVKASSDVPDGEPDWWAGMGAPCRYVDLLVAIGEAAGADLNPDTFLAAAEGLGAFEVASRPFNSLAVGKYDADDNLRIGVFDASQGENGGLDPVTELQDIG